MMDRHWLTDKLLETANILGAHEQRIQALEEAPKRRSSFFSSVMQLIMASSTVAAVIMSLYALLHPQR